MINPRLPIVFLGYALLVLSEVGFTVEPQKASAVDVTILSSNLANGATVGE